MTSSALVGFTVLAVDFGRLTVARAELQAVADAAARHAAWAAAQSSDKAAAAGSAAASVLSEARVDGSNSQIAKGDVELGQWSKQTRTFTSTTDPSAADAVHVTLQANLNASDGTTFRYMLGLGDKSIRVQSIATCTRLTTTKNVPTYGNLWLAGVADNTVNKNNQSNSARWDNSGTTSNPKQRPASLRLSTIGLAPGQSFHAEGILGTGSNGSGMASTGPDGNPNYPVAWGDSNFPTSVPATSCFGIANVRAPLNSCIAVFLDDNDPQGYTAPAGLDFGTAAARDYVSLSPQLRQPFFVGDGVTSTGVRQTITVPASATRIFFGSMDAWRWNDNLGSFDVIVSQISPVVTTR